MPIMALLPLLSKAIGRTNQTKFTGVELMGTPEVRTGDEDGEYRSSGSKPAMAMTLSNLGKPLT